MHEDSVRLLSLMFRPGETICVHHNKYSYHSIPLETAWEDQVTMVPTDPRRPNEIISSDELIFVALNPIYGYRKDANVKAYRNFLIEMDTGPIDQQLQYLKDSGVPYSAAVFSGGKSVHALISLDTDLSESQWRMIAEWILNAVPYSDPLTKNPSRSIRLPGAYRPGGKLQELLEWHGQTKLADLAGWLGKHESAKPKNSDDERKPVGEFNGDYMKPWVWKKLKEGLDPTQSRNQQWFAIACEFALAGCSMDATIGYLHNYFVPEPDFPISEWKTTIKSAYKYMQINRY